MPTKVNILIVSMAKDTQGNRCLLQLDSIWLNDGGKWWAQPPTAMGRGGAGEWGTSYGNRIWGAERLSDGLYDAWHLDKVSSPLTAGQKGTGDHIIDGKYIGRGDIAWKIISVNQEASNWESEEFDVSEFSTGSEG